MLFVEPNSPGYAPVAIVYQPTPVFGGNACTIPFSPSTPARRSIRSDIATGARFVRHDPIVRAIVATACVANLTRTVAMTVLLVYAVRDAWQETGGDLPSIGRILVAGGLLCVGLLAGAVAWATLIG